MTAMTLQDFLRLRVRLGGDAGVENVVVTSLPEIGDKRWLEPRTSDDLARMFQPSTADCSLVVELTADIAPCGLFAMIDELLRSHADYGDLRLSVPSITVLDLGYWVMESAYIEVKPDAFAQFVSRLASSTASTGAYYGVFHSVIGFSVPVGSVPLFFGRRFRELVSVPELASLVTDAFTIDCDMEQLLVWHRPQTLSLS
jgi:hypothetical protein